MKFRPSSNERRKASSDSSSVPPFHCFPPIPHAPYPTSPISSPVLPSFRYLIPSMVLAARSNPGPPKRVKLEEMYRIATLLLLIAGLAGAATIRLYMKDGTYHSVREYEQKGDRIRYYSTERSEWEEIPVDLIDLKRTE